MTVEPVSREAAYARVMELRARGRAQPAPLRALLAAVGLLLLVVSVPLAIVLPEIGVPALLVALRLLAVEFDWAARAYATVTWRWGQLRESYRSRSPAARAAAVLAALAALALVVWIVL